jgi:hypothetical protein
LHAVAFAQKRNRLDDPFALIPIGESWRQIEELADSLFPREVQRDVLAGIATRSR